MTMKIAPTTLWHASRFDIDRPTLSGRTPGSMHDNSGIGIFCSTIADSYITGFGNHIFALEIDSSARRMKMTIGEFGRASRAPDRDRAWFEDYGRQLAQDYDLLDIEELDGQVLQSVILNDRVVIGVERYTVEEFLALCPPPGPLLRRRP